jgi:alkylation response protein AidB-like acyl-CoA dehydrogenase
MDEVREWAQATKLADGRRVIDQPFVRTNLARCYAGGEALKLMLWKQAWTLTHSNLHPAEASAVKVFASEFFVDAYRWLQEILGASGTLDRHSPGALVQGRIERMYRSALILTFGGGTNEVQRDIIAMAGLGLPHYKE